MENWKKFLKESTTFPTAGEYNSYTDPKDPAIEEGEGDGWVDPLKGNPDAQKRYYLQLGAEGQRQFKEEHPEYPYDEWDAGSPLGADEVGEFIIDQGGEEAALAYVEAMRQEIIDMMDEEDEEIQFAKDNPEYTTRTFDDEEEDV